MRYIKPLACAHPPRVHHQAETPSAIRLKQASTIAEIRIQSLGPAKETELIGRDRESNEEDEDAPETAHVKRTAQENFELSDGSQAFMLRRSMPWMQGSSAGLVFVAFGRSLEAFEILLASMTGARDGQVDGLFQFSQPLSGAYFWCPALREGQLDLSPLGL